MADLRLKPASALGRQPPVSDTIGPVTITESMKEALASLASRQGREAEVAALAAGVGLPLPGPGRTEAGNGWAAFWTGPEQWMVEAPVVTHDDIVAALKPIFGEAASVTEQTGAWVRFEVAGPLRPLFERLCNLDLTHLGPGAATRTAVEHIGTYAIRRASDHMTLLAPRSSAFSLRHTLVAAAQSVF